MRTAIAVIGLIVLLGGCERDPYHPQAYGMEPRAPQAYGMAKTYVDPYPYCVAPEPGRIYTPEERIVGARACGATNEQLRLAGLIPPEPVAPTVMYIPPPAPTPRPSIVDCMPSGSSFLCVTIE